jgi:stress response protein SCP2
MLRKFKTSKQNTVLQNVFYGKGWLIMTEKKPKTFYFDIKYFKVFCTKKKLHCVFIQNVTDKGMRVCVDPEGNGVTMNEGAEGGPGPPGGE